ncbi:MAG: hypothetical protein Q9217_006670 [Psora testacea]
MESSLSMKHLIGVLSLTNLVGASIIPEIKPIRSPSSQLTTRDKPAWPYGVIGDSWGSGVAYKDEVLYDKNLDHCLRTSESHGPQLEGDNTWLGDWSSGLRDAACSGSRLFDLAKGGYQMGKVGKPNVVVMTSGGNNCDFGVIVENCVYHPDPLRAYGPAYANDKDRVGECAKALDGASNYIKNFLEVDLSKTINDILIDPNVKDNPDFLLYLTGYAKFFGTDYDPWCNKEAWNPFNGISDTPYLSKELRQAFNDRIDQVNDLYKKTIEGKFSKHARYVDLDSRFQGHRFCEPGMNHGDQFNKETHFDKVHFWNLNWPIRLADKPDIGSPGGNLNAEEAQSLFGDGKGVTAWGGSGSGNGGGNEPGNGWRLRPFHPRYSGYTSIKYAILAQLKKDGLPKAAPSSTNSNPPAPSCSHVGDGFHCECTDGSKPDIDENNRCCLWHLPGGAECFSG